MTYSLNRKARVGEDTIVICDFMSFLAGSGRLQVSIESSNDVTA